MAYDGAASPWRLPVLALGGDFMTGDEMAAHAQQLHIAKGGLYFRGRVGILGDVTAATARDVLAIFPDWLIEKTWSTSHKLSRSTAVEAYVAACHEWGRARLSSFANAGRLAELLGVAVDGIDPPGAALAAAWQRAERPDDEAARVAHTAMVLREVRGAMHFASLTLVNLPITRAVLVDDLGGVTRLRRTGWSESAAEAIVASAREGDEARWREAETATEAAFLGALGDVLAKREVDELAGLLTDAHEASRPA